MIEEYIGDVKAPCLENHLADVPQTPGACTYDDGQPARWAT